MLWDAIFSQREQKRKGRRIFFELTSEPRFASINQAETPLFPGTRNPQCPAPLEHCPALRPKPGRSRLKPPPVRIETKTGAFSVRMV